MMYHKAMLFNDRNAAAQILRETHPHPVKALGRTVKGFDEKLWLKSREAIVRKGNLLKFTKAVADPGLSAATTSKPKGAPLIKGSLREMLDETGSKELVEASPYDRIWGIGFNAEDAEANRPNWGLNLLGKALMSVRDELRHEGAID